MLHNSERINVAALLKLDADQIAQYLTLGNEGEIVLSGVGLNNLSPSQESELETKLRDAAAYFTTERALPIDDLLARLQTIANEESGSQANSPHLSEYSSDTTPPPMSRFAEQEANFDTLVADGGRPVCSIQDLLRLLEKSFDDSRIISPWLNDVACTEEDIKTIPSRQLARWWEFRRWQWANRGEGDSEEEFALFLDAESKKYIKMGAYRVPRSSSFASMKRRQWLSDKVVPEFSGSKAFSRYRDAVKMRLTRHELTLIQELDRNPRRQDEYTNWLEYVAYEQLHLERARAAVRSLEENSQIAWKNLLEKSSSLTSEPSTCEMKELVGNYIKGNRLYRRACTSAYYKELRIEWATKEARLMLDAGLDHKMNKKRERREEYDAAIEVVSKRSKASDCHRSKRLAARVDAAN